MMGQVRTSTKTIERTDIREDTELDDGTPKFFHYVKKNRIVESAVSGNMVVALCGETFPVTKSAKPGSPVCPDCERIYKTLRRK
jgi:formylmethanofuran dehydrogenase subunit E